MFRPEYQLWWFSFNLIFYFTFFLISLSQVQNGLFLIILSFAPGDHDVNKSSYIRNLMFKVWIMHDVWFLNRRRVLKTPHPIFIFFISLLKETWPFVYINLKALWKDVTSHLTWAFCSGELKRLEVTTSIYVFLIFSFCTIVYEHFKQYVVLGFVLELWQLNVQRVWVFILVGGGGWGGVILIPKHCPRGNVWVLCRPSIDLKDKWRFFPKAFQNYTMRGFFSYGHVLHTSFIIVMIF